MGNYNDKVLPIVIVGHVDHGKSTLIGRLIYDTNSLSQEKLGEIERGQAKLGPKVEFAHLIDYLKEEREREMTIDTSQIFFKSQKRRYVVIDTPGHKEFIKNMITGSSQAEAALLIIDATEGVKDQTRRHCHILKILGLKQFCVLINKMDLVDYSQSRYDEIKDQIDKLLNQFDMGSSDIIPISAVKGDNIDSSSLKMGWFEGPTVLEALDNFSELAIETKPLRFPVQDIYKINGLDIIVGRVEAGSLRKAQKVTALPSGENLVVATIEKFLEEKKSIACTGECIGMTLEENFPISRGELLVEDSKDSVLPLTTEDFKANIIWMVEEIYSIGAPLMFKCVTQEIPCSINTIYKCFDPAFVEIVEENSNEIKSAEVAEVKIHLETPAVLDSFNEFPETGRFVLEHRGQPVAGGVIL